MPLLYSATGAGEGGGMTAGRCVLDAESGRSPRQQSSDHAAAAERRGLRAGLAQPGRVSAAVCRQRTWLSGGDQILPVQA